MAIDEDEFAPRAVPPRLRNLEPLSLTELEAYIADLEGEIARVRDEIGRKRAFRAGADSVFKK